MPARSRWGFQEVSRDRGAHYIVLLAAQPGDGRGESIVRKCMKDPEPFLRKAWELNPGKDVRKRILYWEKILLSEGNFQFTSILDPPKESRAELRKRRLTEGDSNDA